MNTAFLVTTCCPFLYVVSVKGTMAACPNAGSRESPVVAQAMHERMMDLGVHSRSILFSGATSRLRTACVNIGALSPSTACRRACTSPFLSSSRAIISCKFGVAVLATIPSRIARSFLSVMVVIFLKKALRLMF